MHLIPADRAHRRMIDGERVCQAIEALGDGHAIQAWARQFSLLGDPTRLRVLVCIAAAEPISVSDLAVATGLTDDHVSQTLRFLRASRTVTAERDGRVIRYRLTDESIRTVLTTSGLSDSPGESRPLPPARGGRTAHRDALAR